MLSRRDIIAKGRRAIKATAKHYGVSVEEVRREIQASIDEAWRTNSLSAMKLQREMFPDGKPIPEEFIVITQLYLETPKL